MALSNGKDTKHEITSCSKTIVMGRVYLGMDKEEVVKKGASERTCFGRTCVGWSQIVAYFIALYVVLAVMFMALLQLWLMANNAQSPLFMLSESLIGDSPGLGYIPYQSGETLRKMQFSSTDNTTYAEYVTLIDAFLMKYKQQDNLKECSFDAKAKDTTSKSCAVDISDLGPCDASESTSTFMNSSVCFYITLNRIYNWMPQTYDNVKELPKEMPEHLKEYIKSLPENERKQVWLSCESDSHGKGHSGPIVFLTSQGFPSYYYPFANQKDYLSPMVVLHLPEAQMNATIDIDCRVWAKNIPFAPARTDRIGHVNIELLIQS